MIGCRLLIVRVQVEVVGFCSQILDAQSYVPAEVEQIDEFLVENM